MSSLSTVAIETLQAFTPGITQLSDHERIELLAAFLDDYEWESDYLATAAEQESFQQDVGELLIEMESRDRLDPAMYESPVLTEIATVGNAFQTELTTKEYVDRPSLIPRATAELEKTPDEDLPQSVTQSEAILVADFEELAEMERHFLAGLADAADAEITAIAERDSRLLSTWR